MERLTWSGENPDENPHLAHLQSLAGDDWLVGDIWSAVKRNDSFAPPRLDDVLQDQTALTLLQTIIRAVVETSFQTVSSIGEGDFIWFTNDVLSLVVDANDKSVFGFNEETIKTFLVKAGFSMKHEDFLLVSETFEQLVSEPANISFIVSKIDEQSLDFEYGHPIRGEHSIGELWLGANIADSDLELDEIQEPLLDIIRWIQNELSVLAWVHNEEPERFKTKERRINAIVRRIKEERNADRVSWVHDDEKLETVARGSIESTGLKPGSMLEDVIDELEKDYDAQEAFMSKHKILLDRKELDTLSFEKQVVEIMKRKFDIWFD